MNPATKVETSWCNVFPVQLMSQSGIHVTVDHIDRGHDCGQIGLSEFRPDPLAEVKKVKTPLGGRKGVASTCHSEEGVGYTMVYNEKPRSSGCSSSEQKSLNLQRCSWR